MKMTGLQNKIIEAIANNSDLNHFYPEWQEEMIYNILKKKKIASSQKSQSLTDVLQAIRTRAEEKGIDVQIDIPQYSRNYNVVTDITMSAIQFRLRLSAIFFPRSCKSIDFSFLNPSDLAEALFEIDELAFEWRSKEWPAFTTECKKNAKSKAVSEIAIETMLANKLKDTGISYLTEKQKIGVKIYFNIGHNSQIEMTLSHKKFMQQIDGVIKAVQGVKELMDETNQMIRLKKLDRWRNWEN